MQAVDHLQLSANLSMVEEEVTGSLHLLGGALKDLGRLDEAEEVRYRQEGCNITYLCHWQGVIEGVRWYSPWDGNPWVFLLTSA